MHLVHGGWKMSAELIELSNALAQVTELAAASAVAVHTEARGSSSGVSWRGGGIRTPRFGRFGATAIPATVVNRVIDTLLEKGRIPQGYLGMGLQPVRLPDSLRESLQRKEKTAIIVLEVEPGSPAQKAGILIGDILLTLAGHPVAQLENVQSQLQAENIGKPLAAKIVRGGAVREFSITVGERLHGVN